MMNCKILNHDMTSHGGLVWEIGKWVEIAKEGNNMCSDQVLHYYNHPALAVLFNPIHGDYKDYRLFEVDVDKEINADSLKFATKRIKIIREIDIPVITIDQAVEFAIHVSFLCYNADDYVLWANNWLNGTDRSSESAERAASAEYVESAAWASARAAARAASAASAASATASVATAAWAAAWAAESAASVVRAESVTVNKKFIEIVEEILNKQQ